jgi:hypothetical protein
MNNIIHINDELSYAKFSNSFVIHNLTETQTENLLTNLDVNSWILRTDMKYGFNLHAITIKTNEGFIHHNGFLFDYNFEVYIISKSYMMIHQNNPTKTLYYKKKYETMEEYLLYLSEIYNLNINKQIIYEND